MMMRMEKRPKLIEGYDPLTHPKGLSCIEMADVWILWENPALELTRQDVMLLRKMKISTK